MTWEERTPEDEAKEAVKQAAHQTQQDSKEWDDLGDNEGENP